MKKNRGTKRISRARAEHMMTQEGVGPSKFLDMKDPFRREDPKNPGNCPNHDNYHTRAKAWKLMGSPVMDDPAEHAKFLASIKVKP